MASRLIIEERKNELIDAINKLGYVVEETSKRPSIIRITGKNKSIRINLKCTKKRTSNEYDHFWFGIIKTVLANVDYVLLAPVDFYGFYVIPVSVFEDNLQSLFQNPKHENRYTFTLDANNEIIFGYSSENYIDLQGMFGYVTERELKQYEFENPELPFFPSLN